MNRTSGSNSLTGASLASFSARCERSMRSWVDRMRKTLPSGVPILSAWTSACTKEVSAGRSTLRPRFRSASSRVFPSLSSLRTTESSSASGPERPLSTTFASAAGKSSPASTLSASKSSPYGRARAGSPAGGSRTPPPPDQPRTSPRAARTGPGERRESSRSYVDGYDAADDHEPGALQEHDRSDQDVTVGGLEHGTDQVRTVRVEKEPHAERQSGDDHPLQLSLAGERGDPPPQPEALANGGRDALEQLRQVSPQLAGDGGGGCYQIKLLRTQPLRHGRERIVQRQPELHLLDQQSELLPQ